MYIYIHIRTCMYIYIYIYMYRERERERDSLVSQSQVLSVLEPNHDKVSMCVLVLYFSCSCVANAST